MKNNPQAPGFYRFHAGDIEVICVNDGTLSSDINAVVGVSVEQARALFDESHFPIEVRNATNNYIIRSQGRRHWWTRVVAHILTLLRASCCRTQPQPVSRPRISTR